MLGNFRGLKISKRCIVLCRKMQKSVRDSFCCKVSCTILLSNILSHPPVKYPVKYPVTYLCQISCHIIMSNILPHPPVITTNLQALLCHFPSLTTVIHFSVSWRVGVGGLCISITMNSPSLGSL